MKITSENWHKKALEARKRFERGVLRGHKPVWISRKDFDSFRQQLIDLGSRRFPWIN